MDRIHDPGAGAGLMIGSVEWSSSRDMVPPVGQMACGNLKSRSGSYVCLAATRRARLPPW